LKVLVADNFELIEYVPILSGLNVTIQVFPDFEMVWIFLDSD